MKVNVVRDLGVLVRGRRVDLGLSQTALAARAGVSRRWLSSFESGKGSVELGLVLRTLAVLELGLHVEPVGGPERQRIAPVSQGNERIDLDVFLAGFDQDRP